MKIKELSLTNFAEYDQVTVSFDENVTYLIGKNGAGKSTIGIYGIWFMFQSIAEKATDGKNPLIGERFRFIGPNAATAKGEMVLVDEKTGAEIKVMRKLTKAGSELSFEGPEGLELDQSWLTDLFNIFLIAPKRFMQLSPQEQAAAIGIDTKKFDDDIKCLKDEAKVIRAVYNSFGEIAEVEKVEKVDITVLQAQKDAIKQRLNSAYQDNKAANTATRDAYEALKKQIDDDVTKFNEVQKNLRDKINTCGERLDSLKAHGYTGSEVAEWIESLGKPQPNQVAADLYPKAPTNLADMPDDYQPKEGELLYLKEMPDDSELKAIDQQIVAAGETNNKALLYDQYLQKKEQKDQKKTELDANKDKQDAKAQERIDYVKTFKFPFSNLTVGEEGQLLLSGKPIKEPYFSTGELLKIIPILISSRNPELKYVFLQDFNLLDEDKWPEIEKYLTEKGFQLVVEMVGKSKLADKNCILLKDNVIVENYEVAEQPTLL
jgi:hypothetical protein